VLCIGLHEVVAVDSIDDDITELEILVSSVSRVVWWGWLVDGPVVEWWVPYWISGRNLSISLEKIEVLSLNADLEVKTEMSPSNNVITHDRLWVHDDWNTFNLESDLINWFRHFSVKLKEANTINTVKNVVSLHEVGVGHLILQEGWLNKNWDALRLGLHEANTINTVKNVVSLHEVGVGHLVLQESWLDEDWDSLGAELEDNFINWLLELGSNLLGLFWWGSSWIDGTLEDLESHVG